MNIINENETKQNKNKKTQTNSNQIQNVKCMTDIQKNNPSHRTKQSSRMQNYDNPSSQHRE